MGRDVDFSKLSLVSSGQWGKQPPKRIMPNQVLLPPSEQTLRHGEYSEIILINVEITQGTGPQHSCLKSNTIYYTLLEFTPPHVCHPPNLAAEGCSKSLHFGPVNMYCCRIPLPSRSWLSGRTWRGKRDFPILQQFYLQLPAPGIEASHWINIALGELKIVACSHKTLHSN